MIEVVSAQPAAAAPLPRRRRRLGRAALGAVAVVVPVLWWATATDQLAPGGGSYGVVSAVAPVAAVNAPFTRTAFIATYVEGERVGLRFSLRNTGRVPVRLTEVFPEQDRLSCGWVPDRVEISPTDARAFRPFRPLWLSPDEAVDLHVSGRFGCGGRQGQQQGLASYLGVPVRWSVAGVLSRSSRVPIGYEFGWTEDPEPYLRLGVDRDAAMSGP